MYGAAERRPALRGPIIHPSGRVPRALKEAWTKKPLEAVLVDIASSADTAQTFLAWRTMDR
ncbi:hypothetical protein Aple_025040 [Acrocarpospora pleiomorpha]|uniref:Uncharacterized protein n=1 Tax=Acrocarpospora pleiomorpha TaxID=90975 RepID=A0A5M3XN46_9ACTN|nr:hypothetical protein Aple_025040 [Acrocarpospora pleiomorpha]